MEPLRKNLKERKICPGKRRKKRKINQC